MISPNASTEVPGARGGDANADDGDLNYGKGKAFSRLVKVVSELELKYRNDFGGFIRGTAPYDAALSRDGVPHGHMNNQYEPGQPLNDNGLFRENRFWSAYFQDAYVYGTIDTGIGKLNARLGKQVVSWGESLFVPVVNLSVPVSVPALRRPGTELKEAFLATNQLSASLGMTNGVTIDGFYQLGWQPTVIERIESVEQHRRSVVRSIATGAEAATARIRPIAQPGSGRSVPSAAS